MPGKSSSRSARSAAKKTRRPAKPVAKKAAAARPLKTAKPAPAKASPRAAAKPTPKPAARKPERPRRERTPLASQPPAPVAPEPQDSGLNGKDLEIFREMLLQRRAQLVGDMTTMRDEALRKGEAAGALSSMPIHMADLGTDNFEQEFTLGLIEGGNQELREIDAALGRIDKGTYGLCQATGKPIGKARLKAQPWAKFCYEYMLAQERGQRRRY